MDKPSENIGPIIRKLTQGTYQDVDTALDTFFVHDAAFDHPFVRVPRFSSTLPVFGDVNSRMVIRAIYHWYRFLSPRTQVTIHSSAFDDKKNILYVGIAQEFCIWFIPLYVAKVRLVTVLYLSSHELTHDAKDNPVEPGSGTRYRITRQEDQYEINEWLNFILPGFGGHLWSIWQFLCAGLCVVLALMSTGFTKVLASFIPPGWPISPSALVGGPA